MIFYCDHESLTVDQNTTFDGFHIDFLRECLERVKNFGKITRDQLDKMRIGSKSVKNIAFKINDVSYYSGIIQIDICNKKNIKNSDIEELFEPNTFLFDFNDQDDNLLAVTVFYRCSKNKFTFDDNSACSPISVSNGKTVAIMCFEQINLSSDKLSCYEIYFEFLKKDLNNHKAEYEIDTNLFREYFQQILKATPDDNTLMLPILNFEKFKRITSAELVYENGKKDIPSRFSFQETDFSVPNRDEQENFVKRLNDEFDVVIPWKKSHRFVRLENLSNADMYKAINILLNEENKNIKLSEDTKGDEIRLDRILDGIKAVEKGHVANKDLVKAICENSIEKFKENYHPNAKRIEALKEEFPLLKYNPEQLVTIDKILSMEENQVDVLLVQGPPGTGKTELIISLAKKLLQNNYTTLLTSNVHVACENIRERMKNDKEVILKSYQKVNDPEEKLDNQKTYIRNQVLSKFEIGGKPVLSEKEFSKQKSRLADLQEQREILEEKNKKTEEENQAFVKQWQKFKNNVDEAKKVFDDCNLKMLILKNQEQAIVDNLENVLKKINDVNALISSFQQENADLSAKILQFEKEISECEQNVKQKQTVLSASGRQLWQNQNNVSDLEAHTNSLMNLSVDEFKNHLLDCVANLTPVLYKEPYPLFQKLSKLILLVQILKNDFNFWNRNGRLSNETLLTLKENFAHIFLQPQVKKYIEIVSIHRSLSVKEKILNFFGFSKNGQSFGAYQFAKKELYAKLSEVRWNYQNYAHIIIDEDGKNTLDKMIESGLQKLQGLEKENVELEKIILDAQSFIKNENAQIAKLKKESASASEIIAANNIKLQKLQHLSAVQDKIAHAQEMIEKAELQITKSAEELEQFEYDNKKLTTNYKNSQVEYQTKKFALEKEMASIKPTLDFIASCQANLSKNGDNTLLFDYIQELHQIAKTEESADLNFFFDGLGIAFDCEFNIDKNDSNGSLISMTTSQVAKLKKQGGIIFDYAIVDEASKCSFEDLIVSLPQIKHLVLIGDYMQLEPFPKDLEEEAEEVKQIFRSNEMYWLDLNKSSFSLLLKQAIHKNYQANIKNFDKSANISVMKRQYRMDKAIFDLISPIYKINDGMEIIDLKNQESNSVLCLNIIEGNESESDSDSDSHSNEKEAEFISKALDFVEKNRDKLPQIKSIGVIAGYADQVKLLRKKLSKNIKGLQIGTIDRFQGKEYDLVFVSLVRTKSLGFLKEIRRMNVAFSRARNHLIILGNFDKISSFALPKQQKYETLLPEQREDLFVRSSLIPDLKKIAYDCKSEDFMIKKLGEMLEVTNE